MGRPGACSFVGSGVAPVRTTRPHFADAITTTHNQRTERWVNTGLGNRCRARRIPICCAAPAAMSMTWRRLGLLRAFVLRSPHAHARIRSIDVRAATADAGRGAGARRQRPGRARRSAPRSPTCRASAATAQPAFACSQLALARDTVRYIGEPVAFVVAETLNQAKDAAEAIAIDYEMLPAVPTLEEATKAGARRGLRQVPGQHRVRARGRQQGGGRRGDRQGRARDQASHADQPAHHQRDGAARRARRIRRARPAPDAARHRAGPAPVPPLPRGRRVQDRRRRRSA